MLTSVANLPPVTNLLPVSMAPPVPVAKFAAGYVDTIIETGGAPLLVNISADF
jgi:hypothetical protein